MCSSRLHAWVLSGCLIASTHRRRRHPCQRAVKRRTSSQSRPLNHRSRPLRRLYLLPSSRSSRHSDGRRHPESKGVYTVSPLRCARRALTGTLNSRRDRRCRVPIRYRQSRQKRLAFPHTNQPQCPRCHPVHRHHPRRQVSHKKIGSSRCSSRGKQAAHSQSREDNTRRHQRRLALLRHSLTSPRRIKRNPINRKRFSRGLTQASCNRPDKSNRLYSHSKLSNRRNGNKWRVSMGSQYGRWRPLRVQTCNRPVKWQRCHRSSGSSRCSLRSSGNSLRRCRNKCSNLRNRKCNHKRRRTDRQMKRSTPTIRACG